MKKRLTTDEILLNFIIVGLIAFLILFFFIATNSWAYASETGFEEPVLSVFDWLNGTMSDSIGNSTWFENGTKNNLHKTLDAGIDAGKTGTNLWFKVHDFFVEAIWTGASEGGADESIRSLIVWVSMFIVFGFLLFLVLKLFKENGKVALIVILILVGLGLAGIFIEW